jgi:hypothetical protein
VLRVFKQSTDFENALLGLIRKKLMPGQPGQEPRDDLLNTVGSSELAACPFASGPRQG